MRPDGNDATPGEPSPEPGQAAPEPGGLMVRTVPIDDPGDLLARIPPAPSPGVGTPGLSAWWGGAKSRESRCPRARTGSLPGRSALGTCSRGPWTGEPGPAARHRPSGFRQLHLDPASDGSVLIVPRVVLGRDQSGQAWLTTISGGPETAAPADDLGGG